MTCAVYQDQAMSVITDICRKKSMESERQQACILMISILEKALFLELCVLRLCGIGPSTARSEDFVREFKRLLEGKNVNSSETLILECNRL
jgi:nuclear pore complex protein Nup188